MGLAEAQIPAVAAAALRDINALTNPVRPTQEQFEQMLRDSM
jgi:alcohol dehydrogenase class IV